MGIADAHTVRRGALAGVLMATVALLTLLAAMAVSASLATQDAQALTTFDTAAGAIPACETCHAKTATHSKAAHVNAGVYNEADPASCANCHPGGDTAVKPLPSKCAVCHGGVTVILSKATHTTTGCGTTVGCHGFSSPSPGTVATTTMTLKAAPTIVRLGKKVKITGTAGPAASLAGAKVALKVERKVGTKWVKMKAATATANSTGAFTWSYKAAKKGAHRVTASITKTATYTAKKLTRTFKVK